MFLLCRKILNRTIRILFDIFLTFNQKEQRILVLSRIPDMFYWKSPNGIPYFQTLFLFWSSCCNLVLLFLKQMKFLVSQIVFFLFCVICCGGKPMIPRVLPLIHFGDASKVVSASPLFSDRVDIYNATSDT